jgi:hypothetical protein
MRKIDPFGEFRWRIKYFPNKTGQPGGNFEFEGLVTETLLLGNVAARSGQKLTWDYSSMRVNSDSAQKQIPARTAKGMGAIKGLLKPFDRDKPL